MPNSSPIFSRDLVLLFCAASAIALAVFPLAIPAHDFDRGIFVSVAERLLAGDHLYAEVWDNKGPLFYYLVALERGAGSFGEILAEFLLVLLASYSVFKLVAVFSCLRNAVLAGLVASPIVLTGVYYFPGYTHLPAISFSFAVLALAAQGRMIWSGLVLGLVPFANILVFPVAVSSVLALCWHRAPAAAYVRLGQGFLLSVALFIALLFLRSELQPFLHSILLNFTYSQGNLLKGQGVVGHLLSHLSLINFNRAKIIAAAICACLLYARFRKRTGSIDPLLLTAAASFCASAVVLATTGLWRQHLQILSIPAILSASAVLICAPKFPVPARLGVMVILSWILSGAANPIRYSEAAMHLAGNWRSLNAPPQDATAIAASSRPGVYARFGKNDDNGHAIGLSKWKLGCARFHQYPFDTDENLKQTLACAAGVDTLLVTPSFAPEQGQPGWNRFVAGGEKLLLSAFHCQYRGALRLCRRVSRE